MKKTIINIFVLVLVVALSFGAGVLVKRLKANAETVGVFKLEYCEEVLTFGDDGLEPYGPIDTPDDAKAAAKYYFEKYRKLRDPLAVAYDAENKTWYIRNITPKNQLGGGKNLIITAEEGKVLSIWFEK